MSTAVIGVPEFKARSGRTVRANEDGSVSFHLGNGYIVPEFVNDAEEFFQARNDARLGRWRWPENPDLVVYPNHGDGQVSVVDERDGSHAHYSRSLCASTAPPRLDGMHAAAHAYFDAHPERKPWHEAKPGEAWVFIIEGRAVAGVLDEDLEFRRVGEPDSWTHVKDANIEDARRIWPEDAS